MSAIRRISVLALVLVPVTAYAGNGTHPRTPVEWEPLPACMTIVDRSESPVVEFEYGIPYEDTELTADEVATSRRHQFLAFCRQHTIQIPLPSWLTMADVEDAQDKGLVDPDLEPEEDIIDLNPDWKDCMVRITGDDERRPINFAEADKPVVWDTTGVPVGAYAINGYTWEPQFNVYWLRNGVVKVVDDPDPAMSPPALALRNLSDDEIIVYKGEDLRLFGCLSATDGSTLTGYWARTDIKDGQLTWNMFADDVPVAGDEFELMFTPPAETQGQLIAIRVDITDPMDRTYTAHMDRLASVLESEAPVETGGGCDGTTFIVDPNCGSGGDSSTGAANTTDASLTGGSGVDATGIVGPTSGAGESSSGGAGSTGGSGPDQTSGEKGCSCAVAGPGASLASTVWLLGLLGLRRRARRV